MISAPWLRPHWLFASCLLVSIVAAPASTFAQDPRTPVPEFTGSRVTVVDSPVSFTSLEPVIKDLEQTSPQTYYVVIVPSAGGGEDEAVDYVDKLAGVWSEQAKSKGLSLDPERSIITLVALNDRRIAVHAGPTLTKEFGLDRATNARLIREAFTPLAREQKYPEAIASLLQALNQEVAVHSGLETKNARVSGPLAVSSKTGTTATTSPASGSNQSSTVLPALLGSLLVVALMMAGLIWLARRRKRNTVEGKIKAFKKNAVDLMDRLDALKARLKNLPKEDHDFTEPITGETLAMFEATQTRLTGLWDRWLEVMDILDKAQELSKKDSALGQKKLEEAEKLVSDSKIFEQIEQEARACSASMDELNQSHENARESATRVAEGQKEIGEQVQKVEKESLPVSPYQPEIDGIAAAAESAREVLTPDPIGARHTLDKARERATELRDRIHQILDHYADGRQISEALKELASQVGEHRSKGLRLDEEGGDPDHPTAQTYQALEDLRNAIHAGDPKSALETLESARKLLSTSQKTLADVLAARELCEKDIPERERETRRLKEAMSQYRAFESELKREFAPATWQAVSGNLEQARVLLDTFDVKTAEAERSGSPTTQKYLLGARLLGQVRNEQQVVFQLMKGVADQLTALKAIREECQAAQRNLADVQSAADLFFRQNQRVIGGMARESLAAAEQSRNQLQRLMGESQPDWIQIRQILARTLDQYTAARNQANADVQTFQQLATELEAVKRDASRVGAFLAGHEEDRLAANQHYRAAVDALDRAQRDVQQNNGEWVRLLETVRGAAADLRHSEQLAIEDIRLARQAEAEIQEAVRTVRRARGYFSMGITLGTTNPESQVAEAQRLYHNQNYEQSIRTAAASIQQVRQAYAIAAQQAYMRQMALETSRRRAMAPPVSGGMFTMGVPAARTAPLQSGPPNTNSSPGSGSRSETAAGSWNTETAGGSW